MQKVAATSALHLHGYLHTLLSVERWNRDIAMMRLDEVGDFTHLYFVLDNVKNMTRILFAFESNSLILRLSFLE